MPAFRFQDALLPVEIDGVLRRADGGGGFEADAEIDRFAVRDAALDAAGVVCLGFQAGGACGGAVGGALGRHGFVSRCRVLFGGAEPGGGTGGKGAGGGGKGARSTATPDWEGATGTWEEVKASLWREPGTSQPPKPEPISKPLVAGMESMAWASMASSLSKHGLEGVRISVGGFME